MNHNIVLIDDNFAIRQIVKIFFANISHKYTLDIRVFTSDNGVEGLGFVFITSPNLVIIDTTLPKYSGREVLDFLIHNPKFHSEETKVIVLHEGKQGNLNLPKNFYVVNKNEKDSFKYFSDLVFNFLSISDPSNSNALFNRLSRFVLRNSNQDDLLNKSIEDQPLFKRFFLRFKWAWLELSTSIILTLIILLYGKAEDENISQQDFDKKAFRTKYYPTLVVTFVSLTIIFINIGLFITSQISLFQDVKESAYALTTFVVNSTADNTDFLVGDGFCDTDNSAGDGPCTLRAALEENNVTVDNVTINFNIPGGGVKILTPATHYPTIGHPATIDATTQPGTDCSTSTLTVQIDGENINASGNGLRINSTDVTIKGFSIVGYTDLPGAAINIQDGGEGIILCNILGLEADGSTEKGNLEGIGVSSTGYAQIGDGTAAGRNIISGNISRGIVVNSTAIADIRGNYIGTDKTGTVAKPNVQGISVGLSESGNKIGGDANLTPNTQCSGDCNLISGNSGAGVRITGSGPGNDAGSIDIQGNFIGINRTGSLALPNETGIEVTYADGVIIGGNSTAARNIISGNTTSGLIVNADYNTPGQSVKDLIIRNNYIGTNSAGSSNIGNGVYGIKMNEYMPDASITGNVISSNDDGISTSFDYEEVPTDSLSILGNKIGTTSDGTGNLGNSNIGINLQGKGVVNIGSDGQGNVIKNSTYGVKFNDAPPPASPENPRSNLGGTISYNTISNNSTAGLLLYGEGILVNNNTFGNNSGWGIQYISGSGVDIIENLIVSSGGITIDDILNPSGANLSKNLGGYPLIRLGSFRNLNDLNDTDIGANHKQNYPVLESAEIYSGNTLIYGTFNSQANTYYRIEAFAYEQPPLNQPYANDYIGDTIIQTDSSGNYDFSTNPLTISGFPIIGPYDKITTTATKCNNSSCSDPIETSELSDGVYGETLLPTNTSTPTPMMTSTPIPTVTNTPVPPPTNTSVPAVVSSPTPISTLAGTRTPVPTASDTPTVTPSEGFSTSDLTPIPSSDATSVPSETVTPVPTTENPVKSLSDSTYVPPEESIANLSVVKSLSLVVAKTAEEVPVIGDFLNAAIEITGRIKPLSDDLSYLLSLQFIGSSVASTGVTTINLLALTAPAIASSFAQPKLFYYALAWFWRKKSRVPWGIISDKISHSPVAFARITLLKDGNRIDSQTTDLQGKYGFILDKGNYQVLISHPDYVDFSQDISVRYDGEILSKDFELASKAQQDFGSSLSWVFYQIRRIIQRNLFILNTLIFSTGFVYTVFAVANSLTVFNYIILSLYILQIVLITVFYFTGGKKWGQVIDIATGEPIPGAIVRLFDNERQLDVTITDMQGRYNFILEPGEYYIRVSAPGFTFPTDDTPNIVTNRAGEKLMKFSLENTERLNIKLYMQRFSNVQVSRNAILSPFN